VKWGRWIAALLPALLGLAGAVLVINVPALPDPILYMRADLGALLTLSGLTVSALLAGGIALWGRAEQQAEQRTRAALAQETARERRRFLRRLDHELKNPLTAIRAGLANVMGDATTSEQQGALESVEAQVLRLSRLTADLRKLSELEARPLERASVNVAELLGEAMALAQEQPGADARRLSLILPQAPWPVPNVSGDWDLLFLAIYNLLDNALKFTRPGDMLEVRASEDESSVVVEIADTGPGIPESEVPRVWEELYRGRAARGVQGSGLGLALVRAIVERHGGQVALRSRVGQGTVVTVRLPVG
jgi:two-component system OmpR family sensor kinase